MAKSSDWRKPKGAVRVPGICRDAEALGVSRQHLRLVLTGKRVGSQRLLSAYAARRQQTKRSNSVKAVVELSPSAMSKEQPPAFPVARAANSKGAKSGFDSGLGASRALYPELFIKAFSGGDPAEPPKVRPVGSYRDGTQIIARPRRRSLRRHRGAPGAESASRPKSPFHSE